MNIQEFANLLNGRQYGKEITKEEEEKAKQLGYVIVFGYSDDIVEFRGAINDEVGCYNGGMILVDSNGVFEQCECECSHSKIAKKNAKLIKVIFGQEYTWQFLAIIPHESFYIYEDNEIYCNGIIFDIKDLK